MNVYIFPFLQMGQDISLHAAIFQLSSDLAVWAECYANSLLIAAMIQRIVWKAYHGVLEGTLNLLVGSLD
jgi:hypothetical protein